MTPVGVALAVLAAASRGGVDPAIIVATISGLIALGSGFLSYRASTRANATSDRKVDLEEFRDQQDRYKKIIDEQDRHIDRVRTQLDRVQEQLAREQDVSFALRSEIRALQGQVDELTRSRARFEERNV